MNDETMNEGAMTHDATNADGALKAPRRVARSGRQQPTADLPVDGDVVLFDTRGQQIDPLPTTMTVAEALDDALGSRLRR
jgi:hypothetical protein